MSGLLTLRGMSRDSLEGLLDSAQEFVSGSLPGAGIHGDATVTMVFFEPSTRTRLSFEKAAHHLGTHVMSFGVEQSSTAKGESGVIRKLRLGSRRQVFRSGSRSSTR